MNTPPDLDPKAIERLQRLGGGKFLGEMIRLFLAYGREKLDEARKAQQADELEGVARAVHPLKSSAGNVGAVRVQSLATNVENQARQLQRNEVADGLAELDEAFEAVRPLLEAEQQRVAGEEA